jgi:hypothetical protein
MKTFRQSRRRHSHLRERAVRATGILVAGGLWLRFAMHVIVSGALTGGYKTGEPQEVTYGPTTGLHVDLGLSIVDEWVVRLYTAAFCAGLVVIYWRASVLVVPVAAPYLLMQAAVPFLEPVWGVLDYARPN